MAGTLTVLLAVFAIYLTEVGVRGQLNLCTSMERCRKDFNDRAREIGHERDQFCQLVNEELKCYNQARTTCPADLLQAVQRQIQNVQNEQRQACGATWIQASHWLMAVSAILAVFFHRRL